MIGRRCPPESLGYGRAAPTAPGTARPSFHTRLRIRRPREKFALCNQRKPPAEFGCEDATLRLGTMSLLARNGIGQPGHSPLTGTRRSPAESELERLMYEGGESHEEIQIGLDARSHGWSDDRHFGLFEAIRKPGTSTCWRRHGRSGRDQSLSPALRGRVLCCGKLRGQALCCKEVCTQALRGQAVCGETLRREALTLTVRCGQTCSSIHNFNEGS